MAHRDRFAPRKLLLAGAMLLLGAVGPVGAAEPVVTFNLACGATAGLCSPTDYIKVTAVIPVPADAAPTVKAEALTKAEAILDKATFMVVDRDAPTSVLMPGSPLKSSVPGERLIDLRPVLTGAIKWDEATRGLIFGKSGTQVALRLDIRPSPESLVSLPFVLDVTPAYRDGTVGLILGEQAPVCEPLGNRTSCALGSTLVLRVLNFSQWMSATTLKAEALTLYLNDIAMTGVTAMPEPAQSKDAAVNAGTRLLRFKLRRDQSNAANMKAWHELLASDEAPTIPLRISLGADSKRWTYSGTTALELPRTYWVPAVVGIAVILALIFGYTVPRNPFSNQGGSRQPATTLRMANVLLASKVAYDGLSDVERESLRKELRFKFLPPHSLSRIQMLLWLTVVLVSVIALVVMFPGSDWINGTVLGLLGISGGSFVLANVIDSATDKDKEIDRVLAEALNGYHADPPSKTIADVGAALKTAREEGLLTTNSFTQDIFAEKSTSRFDLHRVQMAGFTVFYLGVFVVSLYHLLALPEFSANTLALLGISSASYLGYKFGTTK